jgi:hypothetical protein
MPANRESRYRAAQTSRGVSMIAKRRGKLMVGL